MNTPLLQRVPLFVADWRRALFIHFSLTPEVLQPYVPFELDVREGRAYASLVAFAQCDFRPRVGGAWAARLAGLIANHTFLNLRTYVRAAGAPGICFLSEWIPNRLDAFLGPRIYGLPYRLGMIAYRHESATLTGRVSAPSGVVAYEAAVTTPYEPCAAGTLDEFLVERYVAFTRQANVTRCFQIAHDPWPAARATVDLRERTLCDTALPCLTGVGVCAAHYSPGVADVSISPPRRLHAKELL